jgi:hypothetical protein
MRPTSPTIVCDVILIFFSLAAFVLIGGVCLIQHYAEAEAGAEDLAPLIGVGSESLLKAPSSHFGTRVCSPGHFLRRPLGAHVARPYRQTDR